MLYLVATLDPTTKIENAAGDPIFSSFQTLQDVIRWFVEKIRKFFNFVTFYGTLGFKGNLAYTEKSTIGQNIQKYREKLLKSGGNLAKPPQNFAGHPCRQTGTFLGHYGGRKYFLLTFSFKITVFESF